MVISIKSEKVVITEKDLGENRVFLENEKARLNEMIARHSVSTTEIIEIGIVVELNKKLEAVVNALEKIGNKTYGICDVCGKPISPSRLLAHPPVTDCANCREKKGKTTVWH